MNSTHTKPKRRILVVDDEPYSVSGAIRELKERDFQVEEAHTQAEATLLLGQTAYDALLLDLMLPKEAIAEPKLDPPLAENGVSVLNRLVSGEFERNGTSHQVAVFAISALAREAMGVLNEVRKCGVKEVFGKPLSPILVAETIRLTLEEK